MSSGEEDADTSARLANPVLAALDFLVGEWDMTLSDASFLPDRNQTVAGLVVIEQIEAGGLLAMRQMADPTGPPMATWVIGRDGSQDEYVMLYADDRGVSRVYQMTLANRTWRIWRDDPAFSQRFEATADDDRNVIVGEWERRSSSGPWEHDFNVTYARR
jgi:hypothetical protein